jgi:hypothetical protein
MLPAWWALKGFAAIPTTALDLSHSAASSALTTWPEPETPILRRNPFP